MITLINVDEMDIILQSFEIGLSWYLIIMVVSILLLILLYQIHIKVRQLHPAVFIVGVVILLLLTIFAIFGIIKGI